MTKVKKTKFVILGLLMDHPHTGYELLQMLKASTNYFWQESDASIYPTLKVLAQEGLVSSKKVSTGQRSKEVFSITKAGRKEFHLWFQKPPEQEIRRQEFLLKLFFTKKENAPHMREHCKNQLKTMKTLLLEYRAIEKRLKDEFPDEKFWMQTLQNGIMHAETEIQWLEKQLKGKIS